jgi:hypothetical protein
MNRQAFGYNMKNLGLLRQQIKNTYTFKAKFQNFLVMKNMKMFLWKTLYVMIVSFRNLFEKIELYLRQIFLKVLNTGAAGEK